MAQSAMRGQAQGRQGAESAQAPARAEQGGVAWRPLTSFHRIFDDFDRLFEDMQRGFMGGGGLSGRRSPIEAMLGPSPAAGLGGAEAASWAPRIELRDTGREFVVVAELPGVDSADVEIQVTDDGLVLRGEMRQEEEQEEGGVWRSERRYGSFYRLIPLPQDVVDTDQATAEFRNGLLTIRLPKTEAAQQRVRRIQIVGAEPIGQGQEQGRQAAAGGEATGAAGAAGTSGTTGGQGGEGGRRRSA